jgi:hypothetical protein
MYLVLIFVTFWGGKLSYSEIQPFKDVPQCEEAFQHMANLALKDGHKLEEINGGCYWKEDR